jgi:hypothetical protein
LDPLFNRRSTRWQQISPTECLVAPPLLLIGNPL